MAITDQVFSRLRRTLSSIFRIGDIQIKDNSGIAEIRDASDSAYADLQAGDAVFSKVTISDSASEPPITLTARSTAPSTPSTNDIYLDDGTNTASGNPNWLRWTGAAWEELGDGGGSLIVTDGTTSVDPTSTLTFDSDYFTITDEGSDEASVTLGANTTNFNIAQWELLEFNEGTADGTLVFQPPSDAVLATIVVDVTSAASAGSPYIEIGVASDNDAYVTQSDVDLSLVRKWELHQYVDLGASPNAINLYLTPDSQTFAGSIYVLYYTDEGAIISQFPVTEATTASPIQSYPSQNQDCDKELSYTYAGDYIDTLGATDGQLWGKNSTLSTDWFQSFTTINGGLLSEFEVTLQSDFGTIVQPATWSIHPDLSGTLDYSTVLGTGTWSTVQNSVNTVTLGTPVLLQPATKYYILLDGGLQADGWFRRINSESGSSTYAGGTAGVVYNRDFANQSSYTYLYDKEVTMTFTIDSVDLNDSLAQSFKVSDTSTIDDIDLLLKKVNSPTDTMTLRIETDNSNEPSGSLVNANATATLAESTLGSSYGRETFTFAGSFELTQGVLYWIVLTTDRANESTNYVTWGCDSTDPSYANGSALGYYSSDWQEYIDDTDNIFYINGEITSPFSSANTQTMRHIYKGTGTSNYKDVVAIGDLGVYPSIRRRPARTGVIMESGISNGSVVTVATNGEVLVVCAGDINPNDQIRPYYDSTYQDVNGYIGRVIKYEDISDDNENITQDFGAMFAITGGTVGETILAVLLDKNEHEDMQVWVIGSTRLKDTYLVEGIEYDYDSNWIIGTNDLDNAYLGYYENVPILEGSGEY